MNDEIEPAVLLAEVMPEGASMQGFAEALVEQARAEGVDLTGEGRPVTGFIRQLVRTGLDVEMTDHLGYDPTPSKDADRATPATARHPRPSQPTSAKSIYGCQGTGTLGITEQRTRSMFGRG